MTEPGSVPERPDDEGSHASVGTDAQHAEGGRTSGETGVDEAVGSDEEPAGG